MKMPKNCHKIRCHIMMHVIGEHLKHISTFLKHFHTVLSQPFQDMIEARSKDGKELNPAGLTRSKRIC